MPRVTRAAEGTAIEGPEYRVVVPAGQRQRVRLEVPPGRPLADLCLMSSAHPVGGVDELVELAEIDVRQPNLPAGVIEIRQAGRSTCWDRKEAVLSCYEDRLLYAFHVDGTAELEEVQFFEHGDRDPRYLNRPTLSGFWRPARAREGWRASRAHFPRVFSPAPNVAARTSFWSGERATIHPGNEADFWGGDWMFTPAPFAYALGGDGRWLLVGLVARRDELNFTHFEYRGGEEWGLALKYGGGERAAGRWAAPRLELLAAEDPYIGLARHVAARDGVSTYPEAASDGPDWWRQPIWCGWGEQVAWEGERRAMELSTRANYEDWLAALERHGISPGTIVVDDRWQARLGTAEPSAGWSDLEQFIAQQHGQGRRVLLWHNVWEIERPGPDVSLIMRDEHDELLGAFGYPMWDPTAAGFSDRMRALMVGLLAPPPHGLGADGLKLDIIHSTPLREVKELAGPERGNALLRRLLRTLYQEAKDVRPDALIESHAVNPYFRDTLDVVRLNDVFTDLASVVDQMTHRARVARAVGFNLLDTDCWAMPTRDALLEYVEAQPALGIPALYYATLVDRTKEPLRAEDYRRIAAVWERYRRGLS